jgi:hypothetical protein
MREGIFEARLWKWTDREVDIQSGKSLFGNTSVRLCVDVDIGDRKTAMRILICFVPSRLSCVKLNWLQRVTLLLSYLGDFINGFQLK